MEFLFPIIIVFMVMVLPIWIIFHYGSKKHQDRRLTPDDERMLEDLWRSAREMERRLQTLEAITETDQHRPGRADAPRSADRMM